MQASILRAPTLPRCLPDLRGRRFIVRRASGGYSLAVGGDGALSLRIRHLRGDDGFPTLAAIVRLLGPGVTLRPIGERCAVLAPEVYRGAVIRSLEFVTIVADLATPDSARRARYCGRCRACGGWIHVGAPIFWTPETGALHVDCRFEAVEYRA
ncbi:MAG: hypothetical protein R3B70_03360 [Polyangiaceae bacterium]